MFMFVAHFAFSLRCDDGGATVALLAARSFPNLAIVGRYVAIERLSSHYSFQFQMK